MEKSGLELLDFLKKEVPQIDSTDLLGIDDQTINPDITYFRENISRQVTLIVDSFHELFLVGYADSMNKNDGLIQFPIYQNGNWEDSFIKCMVFRTGGYFMRNYFLVGGFGEKLLEFMKQHSGMLLRKNVRIIYDRSDGIIYIDKFEEYEPPQTIPIDEKWERAKLITNPAELY